jgi:hypothetical protein
MKAISPSVQTIIRVPDNLYGQTRRLVQRGAATSVNEFIIEAMNERVKQLLCLVPDAQSVSGGDCLHCQQTSHRLGEDSQGCDSQMLEEHGQ